MPMICFCCAHCEKEVVYWPTKGRRRKYCSPVCQKRGMERAYAKSHPEYFRAKKHRQAHTPNGKLRRQRYMASEKIKTYLSQWRKDHPTKINAYENTRRAQQKQASINNFPAKQWALMLYMCGYCCTYCHKPSTRLTQDHIIPLVHGGDHAWHNITPACQSCNSKKRTGPPLGPVQLLLPLF